MYAKSWRSRRVARCFCRCMIIDLAFAHEVHWRCSCATSTARRLTGPSPRTRAAEAYTTAVKAIVSFWECVGGIACFEKVLYRHHARSSRLSQCPKQHKATTNQAVCAAGSVCDPLPQQPRALLSRAVCLREIVWRVSCMGCRLRNGCILCPWGHLRRNTPDTACKNKKPPS